MKQDMKTQLLIKSPKELLFKLAIPGIIGMLVIGLYPFYGWDICRADCKWGSSEVKTNR